MLGTAHVSLAYRVLRLPLPSIELHSVVLSFSSSLPVKGCRPFLPSCPFPSRSLPLPKMDMVSVSFEPSCSFSGSYDGYPVLSAGFHFIFFVLSTLKTAHLVQELQELSTLERSVYTITVHCQYTAPTPVTLCIEMANTTQNTLHVFFGPSKSQTPTLQSSASSSTSIHDFIKTKAWDCFQSSVNRIAWFDQAFPIYDDFNNTFTEANLIFCHGLLDVLQSAMPPDIDFFQRLPKSTKGIDQKGIWAVYVLTLVKPNHKDLVYTGTGTQAFMGLVNR